jgi:hypothetical protein
MAPIIETDITVTILKDEYKNLLAAADFLNRLYAAGVDNWDGYSEAQDADGDETYEEIYGEEKGQAD